MAGPIFIRRVKAKNYKSIPTCDVELGPLTFLVGPNGSGKSNFLDVLRFVKDSLENNLQHALNKRGGIQEVRRRSTGHPTHFGVRLEFSLPDGSHGHYAFEIAAQQHFGFEVQQEQCVIHGPSTVSAGHYYNLESGIIKGASHLLPPPSKDRLFLVAASSLPAFRPLYDALLGMSFYNLNPSQIRELQSPDAGEWLASDGRNVAAVLARLERFNPRSKSRIQKYLSEIVQGVHEVGRKGIGPKETVEFRQDIAGSKAPWHFLAESMSDGTLRALGILVALFQSKSDGSPVVPLVGIEEPEMALHPTAAGILLDGLREASEHVQVIVTSHSPDLLDNDSIEDRSILAVVCQEGMTRIGPCDQASRKVLHDGLYTAGELLRLGQLGPDLEIISSLERNDLPLFDGAAAS